MGSQEDEDLVLFLVFISCRRYWSSRSRRDGIIDAFHDGGVVDGYGVRSRGVAGGGCRLTGSWDPVGPHVDGLCGGGARGEPQSGGCVGEVDLGADVGGGLAQFVQVGLGSKLGSGSDLDLLNIFEPNLGRSLIKNFRPDPDWV